MTTESFAKAPLSARKIFVSYAREDKSHVKKLSCFLEKNGHTVWWDHLLVPGQDFRDQILQQINDADRVIVVWSSHSVKSPFVIDEAQRANKLSKLLPVIMDVSEPPMGFGHIHAVTAKTLESEYPIILAAIENRLPPTRGEDRKKIQWLKRLLVGATAALILLVGGYGVHHVYEGIKPSSLTGGLNPAFDYKVYSSEKLGIKMVYPKSHLLVDTTQEEQGRIPLVTAARVQEVLVTRTPLPDHNNPRIGQRVERVSLETQGYKINYAGPSNPSNWKDWYILSGEKPNGDEFYYRRWYTDRDVVSIQFEYPKSEMRVYDDAIETMTLNDRFQFSKR